MAPDREAAGVSAAPAPAGGAEYRIDELAREAGTTVRNVRAYQDRGLLAAPRRVGRVGMYSESHLARLRLIGELLSRGYTLANIAEMIASWEAGQDLSELFGLEIALVGPWSEERSSPVSPDGMAALFGSSGDESLIAEAVRLGLIEVVDDEVRAKNPKILEAGAVLVGAGLPAEELLRILSTVTRAVDEVAGEFVGLVSRHIFGPFGTPIPAAEVPRLAAVVRQLRPLAKIVVDAELARAMERRIQAEMGEKFVRDLSKGQAAS